MPRQMEQKMVIAVLVMLAFALLSTLPGKNGMLGFVIYQGDAEGHEFEIGSLAHNTTSTNVSGNELKLNAITETISYDTIEAEIINVSSAFYDGEDKTSRVKNIDDNIVNVNKNEKFNVKFLDNLSNNSKIQMYLMGGNITDIYLCPYFQNCINPGYGKINYGGGIGYYNITLSNMPYNRSSFNIDPPTKVKFDYIRAIKEFNLTHSYNISYYPMQAIAETDDFIPESLYSWQSIIADESINSQTIDYYSSTDSGSTWNYVEGKDISSADASPGKIRLRVLLTSDSIQTPIIRNLSITYSERIVCDPDWQQIDTECMPDDSKLIIYTDTNSCNATENLPADNGTYAYCDYCTPEWQETNSSCLIDDTINQYFIDAKGCYIATGLVSDNNPPGNNTFSCDYCTPLITSSNASCQINDSLMITYSDTMGCYGQTGLVSDMAPAPAEQSCDYCTPEWQEINTSCLHDDTINQYFADANNCYGQTTLESDNDAPANITFSCDYCTPSWQVESMDCMTNGTALLDYADLSNCFAQTSLDSDNNPPPSTNESITCDYCEPSIESGNTSCREDDTFTTYYFDSHNCFGLTGIESDRVVLPENLTGSCDYCTPYFTGHNSSCAEDGTFSVYYTDSNDCYSATGLISDIAPSNATYNCTYAPQNTTNTTQPNITNATGQEAGPGLFKIKIFDADTMTMVEAESTVNFTEDNISIEKAEAETAATLTSLNNINVSISDALKNNISNLTLRFYYNETMLNSSNANESTLVIYYYDEEYDELQEIPSRINVSGGYVEANITHLSIYGLYGMIKQAQEGSSPQQNTEGNGGSSNGQSLPEGSDQGSAEQQPAPDNSGNTAEAPPGDKIPEQDAGELSLGPTYNASEDTGNAQTFYKMGKLITGSLKNSKNIALIGMIVLMLIITYIIIEIKARKGNSL